MKLEILETPIVEAVMNINQFKTELAKDFNIERALAQCISFKEIKELSPDEVISHLWLAMDWGFIIDVIRDIKKDNMDIRLFKCKYEDRVSYEPLAISEDQRQIELKEVRQSGEDVFVINSFVSDTNFNIRNFFYGNTFNYGNKKWSLLQNE